MSLPTPNYVTTVDITCVHGVTGSKILPAGTFVRPVHIYYIPKHVKDDERWDYYVDGQFEFYYTPLGFMLIDIEKIRKIT